MLMLLLLQVRPNLHNPSRVGKTFFINKLLCSRVLPPVFISYIYLSDADAPTAVAAGAVAAAAAAAAVRPLSPDSVQRLKRAILQLKSGLLR